MSVLTRKRVADHRLLIRSDHSFRVKPGIYFFYLLIFRTWHFVVSYSTSVSATRGWVFKSIFLWVPWPGIVGSIRSLRLLLWDDLWGGGKLGASSLSCLPVSLLYRRGLDFKSSSGKRRKGSLGVRVWSGGEENYP